MRLARADDPEAAERAERDETRVRVAKHRAERTVRSNPIEHILQLVRGGRSKH